MADTVLMGRGNTFSNIPRRDWEEELRSAPEHISQRLKFMSHDHHLVRNYVVRELPRLGRPIPLADISHALHLTRERTTSIVEEPPRGGDQNHLCPLWRSDRTRC